MSDKELKAAEIIPRVISGELTGVEAAKLLGTTDRTIRRMKVTVKEGGTAALAHKARGRAGNRRIPTKELKRIKKLLTSKYHDFTPTFAAEKLKELHKIDHDPKTIGRIMVDIGLRGPKRSKGANVVHRTWREPRARLGELVQFDGSYHEWFEDRLPGKQCLLAAIDDATGDIQSLSLREHEGVLPVLGFWQEYAENHGLPQSIYVDKFSTYKMNQACIVENPDVKTQFSRVMAHLRVNVIFANSSQAKGRVERLFRTLQDRLIKELRLQDISTVKEANHFLAEVFIPDFNKRFGKPARETGDLHRPLTVKDHHRTNELFCRHDERVVQHDFTISHETIWYQLLPTPGIAIRPRETSVVRTHVDRSITIAVRGKTVRFKVIPKGARGTHTITPSQSQMKTLVPAT